jgi:hypothetical protein
MDETSFASRKMHYLAYSITQMKLSNCDRT